jgi:hypothetical protein
VAANNAAAEMAAPALNQQSVVPVDYEAGVQGAMASVHYIRPAMKLLHAKARLAELENNRPDAAMSYAELFVLASKSASGGLTVNVLGAIPYQRLAIAKLEELCDGLSTQEKEDVRKLLESDNRLPVNVDEIAEREQVLFKKEHGTLLGTYWLWMANRRPKVAMQRLTSTDEEIVAGCQEVLESLRP